MVYTEHMVTRVLRVAGVIIICSLAIATLSVVFYSTTALTPETADADVSIAYGAVNSPYAYHDTCLSLPRNLSVGSRGDDVAELQAYLVGLRYPGSGSWMITGYFGEATQTVVATMQRERGLPVTGKLDTTTRASLGCSQTYYAPPTAYYAPAQPVPVAYQFAYPYPAYQYFYQPLPPPPPPPAVITNVSGPTTITVNQPGSWIVDVAAPNANTNSTLSVTWSDPNYSSSGVPAVTHSVYGNQSFTFSHTFNSRGIYYVTFTLEDSLKRTSSKTILVTAVERNYPFY